MILERAPAKINLALHVRRRRADGYHELETLFAFAADGDVVTVEPAERWGLTTTGPYARSLEASCSPAKAGAQSATNFGVAAPIGASRRDWTPAFAGEQNLVGRAANLFLETFPDTLPAAITLTKNLPVASGIGGGSADAAATLRALARLMEIAPDDPRLDAIARPLGADVPACLSGRTSLGTGAGETLAQLGDELAGTPLLLVNPGVAVSTAAVFAGWDGMDRGPLPRGDLLARARAGRNDLEAPATALAPVIADVRALLDAAPGTLLARMSGSGATCFALFDTPASRDAAAARAAERGWWTLATTLA